MCKHQYVYTILLLTAIYQKMATIFIEKTV